MKLVMIEWRDAYASCSEWVSRDYVAEFHTVPCVSVGLLSYEDKDCVSLILTINPKNKAQAITIPRGCITRMRKLKC